MPATHRAAARRLVIPRYLRQSVTLAIETRGLTKYYGDVRALDGLDLEIASGEVYGLLGPNGAGKTTLIRILSTLMHPTSGEAMLDGLDVREHSEKVRLKLGLAMQEAALDLNQTGVELLQLQGRLYGLRKREIEQRVEELARLVDIGDSLGRRIFTYSLGMRRRLDLAAAIIHNPQILFLDEPTTGLDPASRHRVWDEILRLNQVNGMTILLTTQYLEEAEHLAGQVGIINGGTMIAEGPPAELRRYFGGDVVVAKVDVDQFPVSRLGTVEGVQSVEVVDGSLVFLVDDGLRALGPITVALAEQGLPAEAVTLRQPTLEEVFLRLTEKQPSQPPGEPGNGG